MIHSGAVIAAGVSQGRSTTLGCDLKVMSGHMPCVGISSSVFNIVRKLWQFTFVNNSVQ